MNGGDSDEDNAMAYFLPIGIADDSPPKRSMLPVGSFGPIGGRTPTAAAGLTGGGFQTRSNSPSFLHLNVSPGASTSAIGTSGASSTAMAGSVATTTSSSNAMSAGSSSSLGGGSFSLAELGGEIHQPRTSAYGAMNDSSNTSSIGPFGFARAFRSGMQSENENALQADASINNNSSIFGRANANTSSSIGGNPFSHGMSSSTATAGSSFFNRPQNDLNASPFAQDNTNTSTTSSSFNGGMPRNWPSPAATTAPANPRRVFQAPPGLGGPDVDNSTRLGLGGDYLAGRMMRSSDSSSGSMQQHVSSSTFGAYPMTTSPAVSDAFRASGANNNSQFGSSSLSSPLSSLHLTSDVFASSSQLLSRNERQAVGITNPDLAELNSHSMKMNDAFGNHSQEPSSSARQTGSPGVKEIHSMKVDVQARSKTSKPLTASAQPFQYQPPSQQQQQQRSATTTQKRIFDKKKQGALQAEFSPMSPTSYREMLVSPASSGRAEHRQVKNATASQLRSSAATSSPTTTAPRSSPATFTTETKSSSRFKKRGESHTGGLRPNRSGVESYSSGAATGGCEADYESSDSADFGFVSDSGDSPIKTSSDAHRFQVREKNDKSSNATTRSSKKERSTRSATIQEKASAGLQVPRRQVYREKQPKEQQQQQAKPRLKSDIQSSDEREIAAGNAQTALKSEQFREGKARGRRVKETLETAPAASSALLSINQSTTGGKSSRVPTSSSFERTDSSDLDTSRGKKSPKQPLSMQTLSLGEKPVKATVDTKPKPSSSAAAAGQVDSPRAALEFEKVSESEIQEERLAEAHAGALEALAKASSSDSGDEVSEGSASSNKKPTTIDDKSAIARRSAAETPPNEEISPTEPPSQVSSEDVSFSEHQAKSSASDKKPTATIKEPQPQSHRKEKTSKRDKTAGDKKKNSSGKHSKKEKRDSPPRSNRESFDVSDISDLDAGVLETPLVSYLEVVKELIGKLSAAILSLVVYVTSVFRNAYSYVSSRLNIKGVLGTALYHIESVTAVMFSVLLLLSLHGASWFIRIHRVAFRAILTHRHIGFCFAFLYAFPFLVQYVFPWAPPWAPVCLWYAFLVQLFCTNGPTAMVTTFRILLPLVFLVEGISHHSFLLDLNGAELLLASFIISALKTSNLCSPIFFISLAAQCLSAVFLGSELVVQWFQMALALYSLHSMVASEDDWNGFNDDEEELSCQSMPMHHSIADYNHHPAPSAASIQKTKRLDRRALAYVRGRKFR